MNDIQYFIITNTFLAGSIEKTKSLFEVIHSSMNHQEKRAYQCIKMISNLIDQLVYL